MTTRLEFQGHETFHKAFLRMMMAGVLGPLLLEALRRGGLELSPLIYATTIASLVVLAGAWRELALSKRLAIAWAVGLIGVGAFALGGGPLGIAGAALCGASILGFQLRGKKLAIALGAGAAALLLAGYTGVKMADVTAVDMPLWLSGLIAGASFAAVATVARLPRHVVVVREPVGEAYVNVAHTSRGEMRELVDRGYATWQKTCASLERGDTNRVLVEEAVLRLFGVAEKWSDVERGGEQGSAAALDAELHKLDERIASTDDEVTKAQYEKAREALLEQQRYLGDIDVSRERVVARMHNYVAAMERLRMAVVNLRSAHASREAVDVQPMVDTLEEIGRELA